MGCSYSSAFGLSHKDLRLGLEEAVCRAQRRRGRVAITGRYHREPKRIEDDYEIEAAVLGKGYNGSVVRAKHRRSGKAFAVKSFILKGMARSKATQLRAEAEIYLGMDHPHVARLMDVYESSSQLHLVMECMTGGELFQRIQQLQRFSEADTARAVLQMLLAVSYLHNHGVVHRDLKLQNFLYESANSDHLKLIDFGFSQLWTPEDTTMKAFVGTLSYMAPEVLYINASYTSQCDLWSLGVVTFILLIGAMPFFGTEIEQMRAIKSGQWKPTDGGRRHATWENLSATAKGFVERLLTVDPKVRMTASQALRHEFVQERKGRVRSAGEVDPAVVDALQDFAKASQFRRAVMEVMAWSLSSEEQAAVRDAFEAIDESCNGIITLAELKQALSRSNVPEETIEPIFRAMDSAKDDKIHYSEFLAAMVSTRIALHDDLLSTTFRRFDVDNSGYITIDNLKRVLGDDFDGVPIESLLKEADFKRDNRISYEEFVRFLSRGGGHKSMRRATLDIIDAEAKTLEIDPWDSWEIRRSMTYAELQSTRPLPSERSTGSRNSGQSVPAKKSSLQAAAHQRRRAANGKRQEALCGEVLRLKLANWGLVRTACCLPVL